MRWCQCCRLLHPLDDFDGDQRSCKVKQAKNSQRKRETRKAGILATGDEGAKVPCSGNCAFSGHASLLLSCA
jgi:hypothetical protein